MKFFFPPEIVEVQGYRYIAVVKPYVVGLRHYEIGQGEANGMYLGVDYDGALKTAKKRISGYFRQVLDFDSTPIKFSDELSEIEIWFRQNTYNLWPESTINWDMVHKYAKTGDFVKSSNWLFTANGWMLIDP